MTLKYHLHIPTLHEFALYAACDEIVKRGAARLKKPMPRPLYYSCIMKFDDKHEGKRGIMELYHSLRINANAPCSCTALAVTVCALDHVVIDEAEADDLRPLVSNLLKKYEENPEAVVECINRFAARCFSHHKLQMMVTVMQKSLTSSSNGYPCKSIREALVKCGVNLFRFSDECYNLAGVTNESMKIAVVCSYDYQGLLRSSFLCIDHAVESGDADTVTFVSQALGGELDDGAEMNAIDFNAHYCELLLSLGVLTPGYHYVLTNVRSVPVIQWFMKHDMIDMEATLINVVDNAMTRGGVYREVLYYLIDDAHVEVPSNILEALDYTLSTFGCDLCVVDYLCRHGADISTVFSVARPFYKPYLIRYWLDNGLAMPESRQVCLVETVYERGSIDDVHDVLQVLGIDMIQWLNTFGDDLFMMACLRGDMPAVELMIENGEQINSIDHTDYVTLLREACNQDNLGLVKLLLDKRGGDEYDNSLITICDSVVGVEIGKILTNHGIRHDREGH